MQLDAVDAFFEEAYVPLPAYVRKSKHRGSKHNRTLSNSKTRPRELPDDLPSHHPLAADQTKCMRNATYGLPESKHKKRSRRKVYVEELECSHGTWYRDPVTGAEQNSAQPQLVPEQTQSAAMTNEMQTQRSQSFRATQSATTMCASLEQCQQVWLNQRRFGADFEISRLIDARERQLVALFKLVEGKPADHIQQHFFDALVAVRRAGLDVVEGYTTLLSQHATQNFSEQRQTALEQAREYMVRHMAHDLVGVNKVEPFASWLGLQLQLNPFISTHRINGSLAVLEDAATQVDEQDLQRNDSRTETSACRAASVTVRQELVMAPAEFRRCCNYGDVVWQAVRSVQLNWVVDHAQQTGEESWGDETGADKTCQGAESYLTQVMELCDNIRQQTLYIKQKVQETTYLYDLCKIAEVFSWWRRYTQRQMARTRRRLDRERFLVATTLCAWSSYTSKMKRLRFVQRQVRERVLTEIVHAWRGAIQELKKPKLLRHRILLKTAKLCLQAWKEYAAGSTTVRAFHRKRRQRMLGECFHSIQSYVILQQYSLYRRLERRTKLSFADTHLLEVCVQRWKQYRMLSSTVVKLEQLRRTCILRNARRHWYKRSHNMLERFIRSLRRWVSSRRRQR